jgi:hypothetical protein
VDLNPETHIVCTEGSKDTSGTAAKIEYSAPRRQVAKVPKQGSIRRKGVVAIKWSDVEPLIVAIKALGRQHM